MINRSIIFISFVFMTAYTSISSQFIKNAILPGYQSSSVEDLNPVMRKRIKKVIDEIENEGFYVKIRATYRSNDYQDFIYLMGRKLNKKITAVNGGNSRHNKLYKGAPGSCAIDLSPVLSSKAEQAAFYKKLIIISKKHGLKTGGSWRQSSEEWKKYSLGWDPGHVYMTTGSCRI